MKKYRIISMLLVFCICSSFFNPIMSESYQAQEKIKSELLEVMDVTYNQLQTGDYVERGELYPCIIWIMDVDLTEAVESGIKAAERISAEVDLVKKLKSTYNIYDKDGLSYIDVSLEPNESNEYIQTYIEAERDAAEKLYLENNNNFVTNNFRARDISDIYISHYSPCVFANLTITQIKNLIKNDEVINIGYAGNEEDIELDVEVSGLNTARNIGMNEAEVQETLELITVDQAWDRYHVSGAGVKVGLLESYSEHAQKVYYLIETVAPYATFYKSWEYSESFSFYRDMEILLSEGVNIINMSFGYATYNNYDERTRWMEHIAYNHDVHIVKSAGNEGSGGVSSPGMAYNIITVGSTLRSTPCIRRTLSSYNAYGASRALYKTYKPDVMAPGTFSSGSGTSYSSALVTGIVALMCEYEPSLKVKQHTVKAILAASTGKETGRYDITDSEFISYGAGVVDARAALWCISRGNYSYSTGTLNSSNTIKTYNMEVSASDTCMRVALAYAYRVEYLMDTGNHLFEDLPMSAGMIGEVGLIIYSPTGQIVAQCVECMGANLKVLEFDPRPYGTGIYTIQIRLLEPQAGGVSTNFGVAWR